MSRKTHSKRCPEEPPQAPLALSVQKVQNDMLTPTPRSRSRGGSTMTKQKGMVALKRAYDEPVPADGMRVLVERLWPRGLSKERAHIDLWLKEIAPSRELRTWFGHDPAKFDEFRHRYETELADAAGQAALTKLRDLARQGPVTLVFAARDTQHSNAAVLRALLLQGA